MRRVMLYLIGATMLCAGFLYAHDPATHMYIGSQTFDVWQDFDPAFYDTLTQETPRGMWVRKFYYMGLTLPDMFSNQGVIRDLIEKLYEVRDDIYHPYGPLYIQDYIYNSVQTEITFNGLPPPNGNLTKLREMVQYAKDHGFSAGDKAMIYGAYMHVVHDIYAGTVLQPSLFGYGFSLDESEDLLLYPENYYETFAATFIDDWDFIIDLYMGRDKLHHQLAIGQFDIYFYCWGIYDPDEAQYLCGWQDYELWTGKPFYPVLKFIEAAIGVNYADSTLTYWGLKSYMHGMAIGMFTLYGYRLSSINSDKGGIIRHSNWTPSDIVDFETDMAETWMGASFPFSIVELFFEDPVFLAFNWIFGLVEDLTGYNHPWPWFLENTEGLAALGPFVPEEYCDEYFEMGNALSLWTENNDIKECYLRSSYQEEPAKAVDLKDRYEATLKGEESLDYNMDGLPVKELSRKAGLLGGMYSVPDVNFCDQPGVFDMHFEFDGGYIYTETSLPMEEDNLPLVDLRYDLLTLGGSKVQIWLDGSSRLAETLLPALSRQKSSLSAAVNQEGELSFQVRSGEKTPNPTIFCLMLDSDYRDTYNSHPEISGNTYYQTLFRDGDPVRETGEDPLDDPKLYWPYVLPVTLYLAYLSTPTDLTADAMSYTGITLNWQDNSSLETSYRIERKLEGGSWSEIGSQGQDETTFTDNTVSPHQKYWYRVRACNETLYSLYSESIYEYAIPIWSDDEEALAFNNGHKVVLAPDGTISIVYVDQYNIWYTESTDGGSTWSDDISISNGNRYNPCACPAMAVASDGTKYVVWRKRGREIKYIFKTDGGWESPERLFYGGQSSAPSVARDNNGQVYVTWVTSKGHSYYDLHYAVLPDASTLTAYPDFLCSVPSYSSITVSEYNVPHIVFISNKGGKKEVATILKHTEYTGGTWSEPRQLSNSLDKERYPALAPGSANTIYAVWEDSTTRSVRFGLYDGTDWNTMTITTISHLHSSERSHPAVFGNGTKAFVAWVDTVPPIDKMYYRPGIYYIESTRYPWSYPSIYWWSPPQRISECGKWARYPHLVMEDETHIRCTWLEGNNIPYEIRPELVSIVPLAPTGLTGVWEHIIKDRADITLQWSPNSEPDLEGYYIYRGESSSGPFEKVGTAEPQETPSFDDIVYAWSSHWYYITAFDLADNESDPSDTIRVDPEYYPACPFLYVWDGMQFIEDNNLLAGSYQGEVVTDLYRLTQSLIETDPPRRYRLEIREEETEHSFFDRVSLRTVDHPEDVEVGVNTEGEIVPVTTAHTPVSAISGGEDYVDVLSNDTSWFEGCAGDTMVVEFGTIEVTENKELWLNSDKSGYPISIEIEREGGWEYVTSAFPRENFSTIPLVSLSELMDDGEVLILRLVWFADHNLKTIRIVQLEDVFILKRISPLIFATHSRLGNVWRKLLYEDEQYVEVLPGDTLRIVFAFLPKIPMRTRSFVFISNGYYITETGRGGSQTAYSNIPVVHSLSLYPNPARNDMTIKFGIPKEERVSLKVYDVSGREVKTLVDGRLEAGYHTIRLDGKSLPSGIYFARLATDNYETTRKLVLMK